MTQRTLLYGSCLLGLLACQPEQRQGHETAESHHHGGSHPAAGTPENASVAEWQAVVMAVHDAVMPKMDEIMQLKGKLNSSLTGYPQRQSPAADKQGGFLKDIEVLLAENAA